MSPNPREVLKGVKVQSDTHAGLWLDKYMSSFQESNAKRDLVEQVSKRISPLYKDFFHRWEQTLEKAGAKTRKAEVKGRLAINLGAEAVLETSISLNHTYGVPYIPGSALKGLAAHYANNCLDPANWGEDSEAFLILFGNPTGSGHVRFFDALYVPNSGFQHQALWPDVITVHHPKYYRGEQVPPADWDSPTPIPFLSATGEYLVALAGPDEWVKAAFDILKLALEEEGIGAKTSSGYGRMILEEDKSPKELIQMDGTVRSFNPQSGRGKLVDDNGKEYSFSRDALQKGWSPARGQKIVFKVVKGGENVTNIEKRFG